MSSLTSDQGSFGTTFDRTYPLVAERSFCRRGPLPELGRDPNRDRQSRYCQGFDPDWWMPPLLAAEWRSFHYPIEATRESVEQWLKRIDCMRVDFYGPFNSPEKAEEFEVDKQNDLELIRKCHPHLVAPAAAKLTLIPEDSYQSVGTQSFPLAAIGELPPDLLSAFNVAVFLASTAMGVSGILSTGIPIERKVVDAVVSMVGTLRSEKIAGRRYIMSVANELSAVRDGLARFGDIIEPNAHLAAFSLARRVMTAICTAADPAQLDRCLVDEKARMNVAAIENNFDAVRRHFCTLRLPNGKEIVAEVQIEAAKAAERRLGSKPADKQRAAGITWQDAAERMERLRSQGEPFTSQQELARRFGCSPATIHKAIHETESLEVWAKRPTAAPRAQGINPIVTDRTPQRSEPDPEDDAAIREFIEGADPEEKAWFHAQSRDDQLSHLNYLAEHPELLSDPDKHQRRRR
jgi:hypothetical protein